MLIRASQKNFTEKNFFFFSFSRKKKERNIIKQTPQTIPRTKKAGSKSPLFFNQHPPHRFLFFSLRLQKKI